MMAKLRLFRTQVEYCEMQISKWFTFENKISSVRATTVYIDIYLPGKKSLEFKVWLSKLP